MPTSTAHVPTDAAPRYVKQLVSHLGRKVPVTDGERLEFGFGTGLVRAESTGVVLEATAADDEALGRVEDVLGRHLERFGQRGRLTVTWARSG
jgi:hypothetical protein